MINSDEPRASIDAHVPPGAVGPQESEQDSRAPAPGSERAELEELREAFAMLEELYRKRNEQYHRTSAELAECKEWAQRLSAELDAQARALARLQQEFEERTNWALALDRELAERTESVRSLTAELEALRACSSGGTVEAA